MRVLELGLLAELLLTGIQDHRQRQVWIGGTMATAMISVLQLLWEQQWKSLAEVLAGTAVLAALLVLLRLGSRGGIGEGDIWILAGMSLTIGPVPCSLVFLIGLSGLAVYSAVGLIRKRLRAHARIPFVPFLAAADLLYMILMR